MITLENVTKIFPNHKDYKILDNISLSINMGSWFSIIGPSGSGKTTLLHCISGLMQPNEGEVYVGDTQLYQLKEAMRSDFRRKHIGFVFQDYKLLPHYSVLDNVVLPLIYDNKRKSLYTRAREILQIVGISEDLYMRLPDGLSGGEKQRVAIARALIADPKILICDEPSGNLDEGNRDKLIDLFSKLHKKGKTIVLVTHDMEVAVHGEKVLHLKNGKLTDNGVMI